MTVKKDETFRFGPFLVTRHADGTETWDDESGHPPIRFLPEEEELPQVNLDRIKLTDDCVKIKEDKTAEPTLETQRDEVAPLRRDDLPTVEQNARLFRSLGRLQAKRTSGKRVWR